MSELTVPSSSLELVDIQQAHNKYDDFVDVCRPILSIAQFQKQRKLPLNEQCAFVFYTKTAHLKDTDFIEIDRSILETIGFKNTFYEQKDKHGNVKLDEAGQPKLKDTRVDFCNALKCLRNTAGFVEGMSFDDENAHFVIKKAGHTGGFPENSRHGGAGQNKQSLWIRMRALEHFIIMANTKNSFMIREYFLDMKHIMTEYNMYQQVYRDKCELCLKDTTIQQLNTKLDHVIEQNEHLIVQNDIQMQKLNTLSSLLYKETDNKVVDVCTKQKKQELAVLRNKNDPTKVEVLRGQSAHVNHQLKRKQNDMELVGKIDTYKNPVNLYNRFGETIKKQNDERFEKTNNKVLLKNGSTAEDLMTTFRRLEDDKHDTAKKVSDTL